jgi:hypothetical protein
MQETKHRLPDQAAAIRKLIARAGDAGFTERDVWEILWLITAPPDLLAFAIAAERILLILKTIPDGSEWQTALADSGIPDWAPFLSWVVEERDRLGHEIEGFGREKNTTGNNPVRGSASTEFPFYAMLCEPLRMGADDERYLLLSAHLLLAHMVALRDHATLDDYRYRGPAIGWKLLPNGVGAAARAVRRFSEKDRHRFLADLPVGLPPDAFVEALEDTPLPEDTDLARDRPHLVRFLAKCWHLQDWRGGSGTGRGGGGKKWVGGGYENLGLTGTRHRLSRDDDPFVDLGEIDWLLPKRESTRKRNLLLDSDLQPDEDGAEEEILLGADDCESTRRDPGALAKTARAKARHVARANQLLPWDYARLTDRESAAVHDALAKWFEELNAKANWTKQDEFAAQTAIVLAAMFLTSAEAERIEDLRLVVANEANETIGFALVFADASPRGEPWWRIRAAEPVYATESAEEDPRLRRRAPFLHLQNPIDGLGELCRRLAAGKPIPRSGLPLITAKIDDLLVHARKWLTTCFPDGRVTLAKLQSHLWLHMVEETGDPALATCATGARDPQSEVRLFYTTPSLDHLAAHYERVTCALVTPDSPQATPPVRGLAVGARLCPTIEAIRRAMQDLWADIDATRNPLDRKTFVAHHNLATLYVLQHFAYATSCRAIVTPYLDIDEIDGERRLAYLDDKDDDSKRKTRLVWIPDRLYEDMQAYREHLMALRMQLANLPAPMRAEPCFFLDERMEPMLARPKIIETFLQRYLPVRANTHRRFLRTELLERGCPAEVVDAFLGHWQQGEEPYGPYSSFAVSRFVDVLMRHLEPLLEEIGFVRKIPLALG